METITLRLKLGIAEPQKKLLLATMLPYTESYNRVCQVAWSQPKVNSTRIHHITYDDERSMSPLPSQLVISARDKACESVKSVRTHEKNHQVSLKKHTAKVKAAQKIGKMLKPRKKRVFSCPVSKGQSIRYDARSSTINLLHGFATLATLDKGNTARVTFEIPAFARDKAKYDTGSADLVQHKNGKLYLHVTVKVPAQEVVSTGQVTGIDVGVTRPAVTSDNVFLGNLVWKILCNRYYQLRRALQAKGTRSAKRHLKRLADREYRFRKDCDHVLSQKIVQSVLAGSTIVLEDLTDIRERLAGNKDFRRMIHGWSFDRLQTFICYKAGLAGIQVKFVPAYYTSQRCSRCHHIEKANRTSQSCFHCKLCNYRLNADLNAARNLRDLYLQEFPSASSLPYAATRGRNGRPVNAPIVSSLPSIPKPRQLSLFAALEPETLAQAHAL